MGQEAQSEVQNGSGSHPDILEGLKALPVGWEGSGVPPGRPGVVESPLENREQSGGPPGGLEGVGRPTLRIGWGREAHPEVLMGLGGPPGGSRCVERPSQKGSEGPHVGPEGPPKGRRGDGRPNRRSLRPTQRSRRPT